MLMLHVDFFSCTVTERGTTKIVENPVSKTTEMEDALLVLASVENQDETNPDSVSKKAVEEVAKLSHQVNVDRIAIHPFAHLFGELSKPEVAVKTLKIIEEGPMQQGSQWLGPSSAGSTL